MCVSKNIYNFFFFYLAFSTKSILTTHQKLIHATQKDWACDCCGSRYGTKHVLKNHMKTHLPPSFACPKCPKKFVNASDLKNHLKVHAGILNQVCKICSEAYSTKNALTSHIVQQHFSKLYCKLPNCSFNSAEKLEHKKHLRTFHGKIDTNLIGKFIQNLDKLKPDFKKLEYV